MRKILLPHVCPPPGAPLRWHIPSLYVFALEATHPHAAAGAAGGGGGHWGCACAAQEQDDEADKPCMFARQGFTFGLVAAHGRLTAVDIQF